MGRGSSKAVGGMQIGGIPKDIQIAQLKEDLANAKGLFAKSRIKDHIEMLEKDFDGTLEEYRAQKYKAVAEQQKKAQEDYQKRKQQEEEEKRQKEAEKKAALENELKTQPKAKVEQYKIIQEHNPANDDYHTWIRKPSDIKTWSEVISEYKKDGDGFSWGDFSYADAQKALKAGKVRVYSSYKIDQGIFVSTSKVQAEQYAGGTGHKVHSMMVALEDVAWINGDEGQYAKRKVKGK